MKQNKSKREGTTFWKIWWWLGYHGLYQLNDWFKSLKWPRWPLLDFYLRLPFISIQTVLMTESNVTATYEYICVQWEIYKWRGRFRLYDTLIRGIAR